MTTEITWVWTLPMVTTGRVVTAGAPLVSCPMASGGFVGPNPVPHRMMVSPGWAVVANCTPKMRASRTALPVLVSVTLLTAMATVTLWLHVWHPLQLFDVEAGASIALIAVAAIRRERPRPHDERRLLNDVPGGDG